MTRFHTIHFLLILAAATSQAAPASNDPAAVASSVFSQVNAKLGNSSSFKDNAAKPMTSPDAAMPTIDGATSFDAQFMAPATKAFLTLTVQAGPTGDLQTVRISQDMNLDSIEDYSYEAPFPVSGVCANGVASCTPGTWIDCNYFKWIGDELGQISLSPTTVSTLGGCYCINSDCGSNIVKTNLSIPLRDLGGGAVGAVQKSRPEFSVSEATLEGSTVTYFGQDLGGSQAKDLAGYFDDSSNLQADASDEILTQTAAPDSFYSLNRQAMANAGTGASVNTCSIQRNVTVFEIKSSEEIFRENGVTGHAHIRSCPSGEEFCFELIVGRLGNNYFKPGFCKEYVDSLILLVQKPELIESVRLAYIDADDRVRAMVGGTAVRDYPSPYECKTSSGDGASFDDDVSSYFKTSGNVKIVIRTKVTDRGEGWSKYILKLDPVAIDGARIITTPGSVPGALFSASVETTQCPTAEDVSNECLALEADSSCILQEETIDGVDAIQNANPTGAVIPAETRTFASGFCSVDISSPWWKKERIYLCRDEEVFDFSEVKERLSVIDESASFDGLSLDYADKRKSEDGEWIEEANSISIPLTPGDQTCEPSCKTRKPTENTQVSATGHVEDPRVGIEIFDYFYRACLPDNTCPMEAGEELMIDCQCINEFAEAAAILLSLKAAQEDVICTSGVKK